MDRLFKIIERVLAICAGISLFIMIILTFVDVIGRYGFNKSIFGTSEMIEFLMVIVVFAGVAFVSASDQHIKVDVLAPWVKRIAPNLQRWTVQLFSLLVYTGLTYELGRHMLGSFHSGKRTAVLDLPQWVLPGTAVLFSATGVVLLAAAIIATRCRLNKFDHIGSDNEPNSEH